MESRVRVVSKDEAQLVAMEFVDDCGTSEAPRSVLGVILILRGQGNRELAPVYRINALSMRPIHGTPKRSVGVELTEEVMSSFPLAESGWIVDPTLILSVMELGAPRVCGHEGAGPRTVSGWLIRLAEDVEREALAIAKCITGNADVV